jgi:hypothetical protein
MQISSTIFLTVISGAAAFAYAGGDTEIKDKSAVVSNAGPAPASPGEKDDSPAAAADDQAQTIPGRDNPVLKRILSPDVKITGEWGGSRLRGFEANVLTIGKVAGEEGSYRLEFVLRTDYGKPQREERIGKLNKGIITLDKPVKGVGLARESYDVLYTVRVDGKDFLVPAVNAENLKAADDLTPKIAYQLRARDDQPRNRGARRKRESTTDAGP